MKERDVMPADLYLYNTMARSNQKFIPRHPGRPVKIFTCGPSIYDWPHIGNYRTFLFEDILERYLQYLGYQVERLINFTDMEDKAIARANELGISLQELTTPVAERFIRDCEMLDIRLPGTIARSTECVDQAVVLIKRLLEKQAAYRHKGDIFFDPLKFSDFGKLFGLDMSRWPQKRTRFRKDTYPGLRWNLGDFILWKKKRPSDGDIYWKTELGEGRPAWNIQDPAMITKHLGRELDICCGGIDNIYRHHDYNIAVVESISGKELAHYWLHGGHVKVGGKKMSKSRGNIVYLSDLVSRGFQPHHIRFFLLYGNYRRSLNMDTERLDCARGKIETLRAMINRINEHRAPAGRTTTAAKNLAGRLEQDFKNCMNDNLDVKSAFDQVYINISNLLDFAVKGNLNADILMVARKSLARINEVLKILY
ncbi:MAG: class I tRNA ligase family protein [Desulfobacteraceae bacterium]|nr:class I tRNA ligase family protein [Desulfobacteraceae bacterium]